MLALVPLALAAAEPESCPLRGHGIQWIADFCLFREQTDDLIAASACIEQQSERTAALGDCGVMLLFKSELCGLHIDQGLRAGSLQACVDDPDFSGNIVRDDGARQFHP